MKLERLTVAPVLALGVTQIVGYGTLYYSFGILAPDMARDSAFRSNGCSGCCLQPFWWVASPRRGSVDGSMRMVPRGS
jgi:hypothetical protein